jgi:porin
MCVSLGWLFFVLPQAEGREYWDHVSRWEGLRDSLENKGISFETIYTAEYWANTQGGMKCDRTFLSNLDLTMAVDTQKADLWENGTFFVYALHNSGTEKLTGEIIGDLQTVSNIEAPRTMRLYELWYEHRFFDEKLSVLAGLHDFNSDFDVTEYGSLFINSSFGITPEIASNARPSIFPLAAPGVRVKWDSDNPWDFMLGVYDGDPGDPEISEHLPRSILASDQGAFIVGETAYHIETEPDSLKMGLWYNSGKFNDVIMAGPNGDPEQKFNNYGGYVVIDKTIFPETEEQGLGAFFQFGGAPRHLNEVDFYYGAGLNYTGLIPGRDHDQAGFAVAYALISRDLVDAGGRHDAEITFEWTYKARICDYFIIQPDIQYIRNPGADVSLEDAVAAGIRVELAL